MHAASMITSLLLEANSSGAGVPPADPGAAAAAPSAPVRPRIAAAEGLRARPSSELLGFRRNGKMLDRLGETSDHASGSEDALLLYIAAGMQATAASLV